MSRHAVHVLTYYVVGLAHKESEGVAGIWRACDSTSHRPALHMNFNFHFHFIFCGSIRQYRIALGEVKQLPVLASTLLPSYHELA